MISGDILSERARLFSRDEALLTVADGRRYTFGELDRRASSLAQLLRAHLGVVKGDRVGILSENSCAFLDAFFAASRSGFILVPLNARSTPAELAQVARDCGMKALLHSERYAANAAELCRLTPVDCSLKLAEDAYAENAHDFERVACTPQDLYLLLYTSGTTGRPKGVMIPHRMVAWNAYNTAASWQLSASDITSICTPLYHAGGQVSMPSLFLLGGRIVLHDGFDAGEVWRHVERERCTFFFGVPTIFEMLTRVPEWSTADLSSLRWCISGGAPLPAPLTALYRQRGLVMKQGYGLTEAGVNCFAISSEDAARKPGSIGRPMLFTQAKLAPVAQTGMGTGANDGVGELCLRGPHVAQGYWNQPEATAAAFDAEGWLHTGDLARVDEEGFFSIAGRLKEMLISGGVNIYPAEIESALLDHPAIAAAAVVAMPDPQWGEVPAAFVVARTPVTPAEILDFLGARMARYKLPKRIEIMADLPRTASGKIAKAELLDKLLRATGG
ncbi:MAG: AMP-binding protein [Terracidiphilus sp.]|jgi:fatty-acyl-CoA synthase